MPKKLMLILFSFLICFLSNLTHAGQQVNQQVEQSVNQDQIILRVAFSRFRRNVIRRHELREHKARFGPVLEELLAKQNYRDARG